MSDISEKSCWGITLWAVALVLGAFLLASVFSGAQQSVALQPELTVNG